MPVVYSGCATCSGASKDARNLLDKTEQVAEETRPFSDMAIGAGLGAIIGHNTGGKAEKGAMWGAGAGFINYLLFGP